MAKATKATVEDTEADDLRVLLDALGSTSASTGMGESAKLMQLMKINNALDTYDYSDASMRTQIVLDMAKAKATAALSKKAAPITASAPIDAEVAGKNNYAPVEEIVVQDAPKTAAATDVMDIFSFL